MANEKNKTDELTLTRLLDADRETVYKAFCEPEQFIKWWPPKDFENKMIEFDLRPGGFCRFGMTSKDFSLYARFQFIEIVPFEKIVFSFVFTNEKGQPIPNPMDANWPMQMLHILSFTEEKEKTTLTLQVSPYNATATESAVFVEGFDSMRGGYGSSFEQLDKLLASL